MPVAVNNTIGAFTVLTGLFVQGLAFSLYATHEKNLLGRRRRIDKLTSLDLVDDDDIKLAGREMLLKVKPKTQSITI